MLYAVRARPSSVDQQEYKKYCEVTKQNIPCDLSGLLLFTDMCRLHLVMVIACYISPYELDLLFT